MKRVICAIVALFFTTSMLIASSATPKTEATTAWPLQIDGLIRDFVVDDTSRLAMTTCQAQQGQPLFRFYDPQGVLRNTVTQLPDQVIQCSSKQGISEVATLEGTFYGTILTNAGNGLSYHSSTLVAYKNNRQLWSIDTSASSNCTGGVDRRYRSGSLSIGADGNIYAVLTPTQWASNCPLRYVAIDPGTGTMTEIATAPSAVTTFSGVVKMWTFDDSIRFIDRAGTVYEYDYDWVENVSARHSFTLPVSHYFYYFTADQEGTVFANTATNGWSSNVLYVKVDGSEGSIVTPNGYGMERFIPGVDGTLLQAYNYTVNSYDPSTDSVSTLLTMTNPHSTTYPNGEIVGVASDEDGNLLIVSQFYSSNWADRLVSVDVIESGTTTPVNLFQIEKDTDTNPAVTVFDIDRSISNGYLYLSLCHLNDYTDCATPSTAESWIHKIELSGFGEPIQDRYDYSGYESQKLEYVAMGDSFSSGEGVEPFLLGTDVDSVNECHRSENAYSMLLEKDPTLDLNLMAFVACSGATTDTVLNGGSGTGAWDEPAQVEALSESTDVVTITIGGNDVAFADYIFGCVAACGPVTSPLIYDAMMDGIEAPAFKLNLMYMYEDILEAAPNATIYVMDYPYLSTPLQGTCGVLDLTGAFQVTTALNEVIHSAVSEVGENNSRLVLVDVNEDPAPFLGGEVCGLNPMFNVLDAFNMEYSFHPNTLGQEAFKTVLKDSIGN